MSMFFLPDNVRDVTDAMLLSQLEDEEQEIEPSQRISKEQVVHTLMDMFTGQSL